jgi:hypothetical protein
MSDPKWLDSIDFKVQRHGRRDLRMMHPELWVSLAIALVSSILALVQVYETIDVRSRLQSTEMQVKSTEARAADLATKNRMLTEELTQAKALIESLRNRPQTPPKSPARKGGGYYGLYPR